MARRRHRRSYKGYGRHRHRRSRSGRFGFLSPGRVLRESVSVKDMGIGGLVGVVGGLGALYILNKVNASRAANKQTAIGVTVDASGTPAPSAWVPALPAIGGLAIGIAGYMLTKKSPRRAFGLLGGAAAGGLAIAAFQFIKGKNPTAFGDYLKVKMPGMGNVLVHSGALSNYLISTPVSRAAGSGLFPASRAVQPRGPMGGYLKYRVG